MAGKKFLLSFLLLLLSIPIPSLAADSIFTRFKGRDASFVNLSTNHFEANDIRSNSLTTGRLSADTITWRNLEGVVIDGTDTVINNYIETEGLSPKGAWSSATQYAEGNIVSYNGSSWVALRDNLNVTPVNGLDWWIIAEKGANGSNGATGPQGIQGIQGEKGDKGDTGERGLQGDVGPQGLQGVGVEAGTDGTYGWLSLSNTTSFTPCAAGYYGLTFIGGNLKQCADGSLSDIQTGTSGEATTLSAQYIDWNASSGGASIANKPDLTGKLLEPGTDGTFGWTTSTNTSTYTECAAGDYGLNWIGGDLYQCKNGTNSLLQTGGGSATPVSVPTYSDTACTTNDYSFDANYYYTCVATNTWKRVAWGTWNSPTPDTTPDAFSFTDQTDVALNSTITSAPITVAGLNTTSPITVTGGTYSINSESTFTSSAGNVSNGDLVRARHTSSASNNTSTNTAISIGGVSDTFTSTTVATSYADILFFWDAESLTAPITSTKGNSSGTNTGSILTTTAKTGTYALSKDNNSDIMTFALSASHFNMSNGVLAFWWQAPIAWQSGSYNELFYISDGTSSNYMRVQRHSSGGIKVGWVGAGAFNDVAEYTTALSDNTWYYIVVKWNPAGTGLSLTIYNEAGSVVGSGSDASLSAMNVQPNSMRINGNPLDAGRALIDHIILGNDSSRAMWGVSNVTSF